MKTLTVIPLLTLLLFTTSSLFAQATAEAKKSAPAKKGSVDPDAPAPPVPDEYLRNPPPGWLPVNHLDDSLSWKAVREVTDKALLYFPRGEAPVRGVYVSVVFHSQDPRELARLWDFALVTVPWTMLYDLGLGDSRSPRSKQTGYPLGNMGFLLHYLERAAQATKHPELATVPIAGWLMQGGYEHAPDLYKRAPDRLIAWSDSFAHILRHEKFLENVPFVAAWELSGAMSAKRKADKEKSFDAVQGQLTPPPNLYCEATTYDFNHGVYSKWNLFAIYLDRCIKARLPDSLPAPGQQVKIKPVDRANGWVADFNEFTNWAAIAPYREARGMVSPMWLPDAYSAWAYRAFHSQDPQLAMVSPVREYLSSSHFPQGDRGPCGLGFGGIEGRVGTPIILEAGPRIYLDKKKREPGEWPYAKVIFHDGDRVLGTVENAPWKLDGVKLEAGLHALFAVGVQADGSQDCSRPALYGVR